MTIFTDLLTKGISAPDLALTIPRAVVGVFFAMSGGNKLFTEIGHKNLCASLHGCRIPWVPVMCWWVAFWEFFSGILLTLGLLSAFNAAVLAIVCIVATWGTGPRKVNSRSNFNCWDRATNWLFLPEVLMIALLAITMLMGPGAYSVDNLLFN
jgi:putative oxidoreductase